jgi:hypothetical protein
MCRCTEIMSFQNPPYMASRQLMIPRIVATGTSLSPLPCRYDNPRHTASCSLSITGYRLREGWVGHMDRVAAPQKVLGTGIFSKNPPYRVFPAADDPKDLRYQIVPLLRLRPSSILRSLQSPPQGRLKNLTGLSATSELHTLVLHPGCPPPTPTPSSHR